jgi:hypothetical protein
MTAVGWRAKRADSAERTDPRTGEALGLDWDALALVDLAALVRDVDDKQLSEMLANLTYAQLDREEVLRYADPNFVKLFRLAQVTIEYLFHQQSETVARANTLSAARADKARRVAELKQLQAEEDAKVAQLKSEVKFKKRTCRTFEYLLAQSAKRAGDGDASAAAALEGGPSSFEAAAAAAASSSLQADLCAQQQQMLMQMQMQQMGVGGSGGGDYVSRRRRQQEEEEEEERRRRRRRHEEEDELEAARRTRRAAADDAAAAAAAAAGGNPAAAASTPAAASSAAAPVSVSKQMSEVAASMAEATRQLSVQLAEQTQKHHSEILAMRKELADEMRDREASIKEKLVADMKKKSVVFWLLGCF